MAHIAPLRHGEEDIPAVLGVDEIIKRTAPRRVISVKPLSLLAVLVFWQLTATLNGRMHFYNARLFPAPLDIVRAGWEMWQTGELQRDIAASMVRVVSGLGLATPVGVLLGIGVARVRWIENIVEPVIELLRPVPTLALLPMMVLWFGIGESSKILFIAYSCFFVIFTTTLVGVRNVDPVLLRAGQSLGLSRLQMYRYLILPGALPDIMLGVRLGLSVGFLIIVAAEFIAASTGLGYLINYSRTWFRVDQMLLGAAVIGLLGVISNYLLVALENRLFRWRATAN